MARTEYDKSIRRQQFVSKNMALLTIKTANRFRKITNQTFAERNVDVIVDGLQIWITIHFNKFEISNSKDQKHEIVDFYVKFSVTLNNVGKPILKHRLQGFRATVSLAEAISGNGYGHSHLNGLGNFTIFCFGEGETPINMIQADLQTMPSWELYEMFLLQIIPFIQWESLEGVPYFSFQNIGYNSLSHLDNDELTRSLKSFILLVTEKKFTIPMDYRIVGNHGVILKLKETSELINLIYQASTIKGMIGEDGVFRNEVTNSLILKKWYEKKEEYKNSHIIFKNRRVPLTILKPIINPVGSFIGTTHAHPKIQLYILSQYNKYLVTYSYDNQKQLQSYGCAESDIPRDEQIYKRQNNKRKNNQIWFPLTTATVTSTSTRQAYIDDLEPF